MWTTDLYRMRTLLWRVRQSRKFPRPVLVGETVMPNGPDMLKYSIKFPKVAYQSDIAARQLRIYVNLELVKVETIPTTENVFSFEVPQDAEVKLVLISFDDAKPTPNSAESEPFIFTAVDKTPPKAETFPAVVYEGETDGEVEDTPTTEAPSETTEAPSESTEAPSETTEAPSESTEAPSESTEAPSETTEAPVVEDPSLPTVDPASESTPATFPDVEPEPVDPGATEDSPGTVPPAE